MNGPRKARQQTSAEYLAVLNEYDAAMRQFSKGNYEKAAQLFEKIVSSPARDIADRAQAHLRWCRQKLETQAGAPKTAEELYVRGVAELNAGHLDMALEYLAKADKLSPSTEYILYARAAAYARHGNADAALERLAESIRLRPGNRAQALHDEDFQPLAGDPRLIQLVKPGQG